MGFFDKLMFWKKDDDFGLNDLKTDFNAPQQTPGFGQSGFGQQTDSFGAGAQGSFGANQAGGFGNDSFGSSHSFGQQQSFGARADYEIRPVQPPQQSGGSGRDTELILSKLDAIRQALDAISQRLENVERVALAEEQETKRKQRGW